MADETPVLDLLAAMTADSIEASSLGGDELMLVRLAALVASDAPPASYLLNLGAAADTGLDLEDVQGVLAAVAPIVGTARVVKATGAIVELPHEGWITTTLLGGRRVLRVRLMNPRTTVQDLEAMLDGLTREAADVR